jgi:hypothetical protein
MSSPEPMVPASKMLGGYPTNALPTMAMTATAVVATSRTFFVSINSPMKVETPFHCCVAHRVIVCVAPCACPALVLIGIAL